jgi:DNA replication protein DnaC
MAEGHEKVDELPVDMTSEREGMNPFGVLVKRFCEQVEAKIVEREARGETIAPPSVDIAAEVRGKLQRLADRQIPLRAARVIVGAAADGSDGDGPIDLETPAMRLVRGFMTDKPGTIAIAGGVGCGKTLAAAWAVAQKVRDRYFGAHPDGRDGTWPADYHPRFIDAARLARLPRFAGKGESAAALSPYERCSVLAIDDVGMENDVGFVGILDSLIVTRHEDGLRTILTTNMPSEEFDPRYGARVADRLKGSGGYWELNEPSRRKKT